ncbi:MAG: hypothetical protein HY238_16305 [Acidobacteria bacterium]|nr:hypothetical protein [Acidobacteriota bacterium]
MQGRREFVSVTKDVVTILAVFVGGYWTFRLYDQHRENRPRLSIEHRVTHRPLPPDKVLLIIDARVTNTGKVLIKPLVSPEWPM